MHSASCASQTFHTTNLQLRRTQSRRVGAGRFFEPVATIFWALASLVALTVAAFA